MQTLQQLLWPQRRPGRTQLRNDTHCPPMSIVILSYLSLTTPPAGPKQDPGSKVSSPAGELPQGYAGRQGSGGNTHTNTHTHKSLNKQSPSCPRAHNYAVLKQSRASKEQPSLCLSQTVCAAQVAQLADEAAEAVHLLDGPDEEKAGARLHLVLDALDKVVAKAEGLLRAGQGPLALEALVAVAGEVVRPDEIPGTP